MAYNAIDIAKKIVCRTDVEHGDTISNLKLQKLLYYMQGFHLALFDAPFFNEPIEAWTYGPVVQVVFREFKRYQNRAINPENYHDELVLTGEEQLMFDRVYDKYNRFSAVALMQMTHNEGPWKSHDIGEVIANDELRTYFLTQINPDEPFPPCVRSREEMIALCDQRMEDILSGRAPTLPHNEVMHRMKEKHGLAL
jgi:uncharacterized phage-associated protein